MTMFKTYVYKDSKRAPDQKRKPINRNNLFTFKFDEVPLPYFELIPSRLLSDPRYLALSRHEQGDFLRFLMYLWLDRGRHVRCSQLIGQLMGMEAGEWETLEGRLLDLKLLESSPDGFFIIQTSMREQYLFNRQANLNKKRLKKATEAADDLADECAR